MAALSSLSPSPETGGASALAEVLAQAILSGRWQPGDDFPRELDLCHHFDASRNRVRNALAELVSAGLIERVAGRGTLVRDVIDWHLLDPQMSRWMASLEAPHPELIAAVFSFRLAAEPYISELAALHATGEDLARIERAFEGMLSTADLPHLRLTHAEYDVAFHDAIYRASHNLVWRQLGLLLRPCIVALIQRSQDQATGQAEGLSDSLERHRQLLEAIRLRQPAQARQATESLLERTARDLGSLAPGQGVMAPSTRPSL
ncbi:MULTISPECIES: FadR/GntR family transcriptional regulator [Halomonas]|uniref:FadR/GntR family transcriptional regulator n=1 Tax=Halomonas TaxID=2745 RepID=UPI001C9723B4|nr:MULTISPECIES: FCD domain-containing protein [Halomonas]MBY5930298.1 FCD domain-containing protein [Halomonas sp. DP8Y7-3]MBY5985916.1 FCD domain-containing protein [Halomonas sp. DP5Y7-2]MBY6206679.1 FCD domain-containing protein [Halomonas sp. DP3Y7-2]MBY6230210.1 FCD domain-containing protein [Halomonas sp. DP3Y7-1]MCA0918340.1 FCD domain-containing protein [Halomonas denitrificans]